MADERDGTISLPLHAEDLAVERRTVAGDHVVVRTVTTARDVLIDELLAAEHVEIERVAVRRLIDEAPPVREEGDTVVVPVIEEVLVTERRLFLKEEIHIRRVRTTERHRETVTLREEEAVITRTSPDVDETHPGFDSLEGNDHAK